MDELEDDRIELLKDISKLKDVLGDDDDGDDEFEEEDDEDDYDDDDDDDDDDYEAVSDYFIENWSFEGNDSAIVSTSTKKDYLSSLQNDLDIIAQEPDNNLKKCLLMNQSYQNALMDKIMQLETILESNLEHQKSIQEGIDEIDKEKNTPSGRKTLSTFQAPYFKDVNGQIPPMNEDAKIKMKNKEITAYVIPNKAWSDFERVSLEKAVASNFKEKLLSPLLMKKGILKEKLTVQEFTDEEYLATAKKLEEIKARIENIKSKSKTECIGPRGSNLDWMKISVVGLNGNRQPEECELMWNNFMHLSINKERWSELEKISLMDAVVKYGYRDWDKIAEELQTNRTAWQCLQKYQKETSLSNSCGSWTKDEDIRLMEVVQACKVGGYIPWHQVAYYMEGRTRNQLQERWKRTKTKKGRWKKKEDMILIIAVKKHGEDWGKVARYLPGRSNNQCRERYRNSLDESVILGSWTAAEDKKLLKLVKEIGEGKWTQISHQLPGRTDNSVYQRYRLIISRVPNALDTVNEEIEEVGSSDKPLIRTVTCQKKIERRNTVYQALRDQIVNLKLKEPSTSAESVPENLNGIDITTINRLLNKLLPSTKQNDAPKIRKKSLRESSVDSALDALLLPLTVTSFQKPKMRALGGAEAAERSLAKSLLYKYFRLENPDESDVIDDVKMRTDMDNLFKNFIIGKNTKSLGNDIPIFPPNRITLNSLKLFLSNRKQLVLSSRQVKNVNAISALTARTSARSMITCSNCLFKESYNLSQRMNIQKNVVSYSAIQNQLRNADGASSSTSNEDNASLSSKRKRNEPPEMISKKAKLSMDEVGEETTTKNKNSINETDSASNSGECLTESASSLEMAQKTNDEANTEQCNGTMPSVCKDCEYTRTLNDDFQLLKKRFLATFFWPGLLSTIRPNYEKPVNKKKERSKKRHRAVTQRRKKKPWVTEILRKRHLEQNHKLKDADKEKSTTECNKKQQKPKSRVVKEMPKSRVVPKPTRKSLRQAGKQPEEQIVGRTRSLSLKNRRSLSINPGRNLKY